MTWKMVDQGWGRVHRGGSLSAIRRPVACCHTGAATVASAGPVRETGIERGIVDCIACGSAMSERANFCARCGTSVTRACSGCGHEVPPSARFCEQCGTAFGSATTDSVPEHLEATDRAVRKSVTVLFADLIGSTSFGESVDAESVRDTHNLYYAMARRVIDDHGGFLAKFIGDGLMAVFGVPETSEDDASRAVAAGVALQSEFASIAGRAERQFGIELGLRVGINTGEVVIGTGDDDLVGDAVTTAARLETACRPGEVLVGESTWRLTRSAVDYDALGDLKVKGKAEPIATFQVVAPARLDPDEPSPFVGRAAELSTMRSVFDDVASGRMARLVSVIGSPGVGKTRLTREFVSTIADVAGVVEMRCRRSGTATFAPIADALRSNADIKEVDDPESIVRSIHGLVADLHDANRVAELLATFLDDEAVRTTEEAFFAVRRLTEATARVRPVVIVVDDIQWAEPLFLDLLEHLAEWVDDAGVMILTLARPEIRERRPSFSTESRTLEAVIQLDGLDAPETAELARRLVGSGSLPDELVDRLPTSTEGNPLFVRELMKALVDDGVIVDVDGAWRLTIDVDAVEVPPTIQALLAARLERLPGDERRMLELASVVGSEFPLGAVQTIAPSGTVEPADVRTVMERLHRRELVEPTDRYWGDEAVYRFHHALIRDAAYRRILKRRRADLHVAVGEWTERTAEGLPGEHHASVGYHHECAYGYLRELSADDAEARPVGRTAARLFGVAAQRSLDRDDVAAAGALAERAIACTSPEDPAAADLLVTGCEALLVVGEIARGAELLNRLRALDADPRVRCWAACFHAELTVMTQPDQVQATLPLLDSTAAEFAEIGDQSGVAKARLVRAQALARMGRIGECESELDVALTAARAAEDRRRVAAVLGAAPVAALWGPSPIPRAGGRCLDVIRLLRITGGSPAVEATSTRCQAVLEALRGRFDTARSMLAEARSMVEELGLSHAVHATEFYAGIVELLAGHHATAEPRLRDAFEGLDRLGLGADAGHVAAYLARSLIGLGRLDEADEFARTAEQRAGRNPQTGISARAVRAEVAERMGNVDEAVVLAEEAVAMAAATDLVVDHADASTVLAVVAAAAGDESTAMRARRDAAALAERKGCAPTISVDVSDDVDPPASAGPVVGTGTVVVDRMSTQSGSIVDHPASTVRRVLSTAEGLLSLSELRADHGFQCFAVEEFGPSGERSRMTLFDPTTDGLGNAEEFAEQRYGQLTDAPPSYFVICRLTMAMQRRDIPTIDEFAEPDFVFVDRRTMGFPPLTKTELIEMYRKLPQPAGYLVGDVLEITSHGLVYRGAQLTVSASGELDESMPACSIVVANSRRVERMELFAEDDVDRAIARLRELAPTTLERPAILDHAAEVPLDAAVLASADRRDIETWHPTASIVELDGGSDFRRFAVEAFDSEGNTLAVDLFPATTAGLAAASQAYHQKIGPTFEHSAVWQLTYDYGVAITAVDLDALSRFLPPDFVFEDHRALGFPRMDRSELLDLMGDLTEVPDTVWVGDEPLALTARGLVQRMTAVSVGEHGGFDEQMPACALMVTNGTHIVHTELYDEEDAERALARFYDLTAESRPPSNIENRSTLTVDRGADDPAMSIEHLAVRGQRHSMHRARSSTRGQGDDRVVVVEVDSNGRLADTVEFDGDARDAATAELDRRWFASLDAIERSVVDVGVRYGRATATWDVTIFEQLLADGFAYYDATTLGAGWLDRTAFLASQALRSELDGPRDAQVFDIVELTEPDVLLSRSRSTGVGQHWDASWERRQIVVLHILDGLVHRFGLFAYDDLDAARQWARELSDPEPLDNLARQVARRMLAAMNDGSLHARQDEFFEPDWRRVDHRTVAGTGEIDRSTHADLATTLSARAASTPIAIRGDLFSLSLGSTHFEGDDESRYLVMSEVGPAGRQVRVDMFDEDALDAAVSELDDRWRASLSESERRTLATRDAWGRTFDEVDTATATTLLAPGFWFDDRQRFGAGVLDRDGYLALHRESGVHGRSQRRHHAVQFVSPEVVVVNTSVAGVAVETGLDWSKTLWNVVEIADGVVHHVAGFDSTCRAAAHEYATTIAAVSHRDDARWNRAARVADRLARRLAAGVAPTRELLANDFSWSTVGVDGHVTEADSDPFVDIDSGPYQPGVNVQFRPIARRGDDFVLLREVAEPASAPTRLTFIAVDDGRLVEVAHYDPDALVAALAGLSRAWFATLSPDERTTVSVTGEFGRAFREQDPSAFDRVLAADFIAVDAGEFGLGEMNREQYLASHHGRNDLFGRPGMSHDIAELPAPNVMIVRSTVVLSPDEVGWEDVTWNVLHVRDNRLARLEVCNEMEPDDPAPRAWAHQRAREIIDHTTN